MDFLKSQLDRIQLQLNGLSATQKMLTASLVAIMVLTVMWWGKFASTPVMEPLLNQSFSPDDISRITMQLESKRVDYTVSGDKILIPADRKFEVLADLGYARLLPQDTKTGFDEMVNKMTAWDPQAKTEMFMNHGKETMIAQIIRRFPNVANADVIIDPTVKRMIDGSIQPSATVNISMKDGMKPGRQLIQAAADVVSGAQAGISRSRVKVIVDGVSFDAGDRSTNPLGGSTEMVEMIQVNERYYSDKISEQLAFIKGAMVSVTVKLNTKTLREVSKQVDPKNTVQKEQSTHTRTEESSSNQGMSTGPGGLPNVGLSTSGASGNDTSTIEDSKTEFYIETSQVQTETSTPAGDATVIAASVRVPRSYFVGIYKNANPQGKDPDDTLLKPLIDAELPQIRKDVKTCTGLANDEAVNVSAYFDSIPLLAIAPETSTASVTGLVGGHSKEIAVGVLAVISLFMVSMMVRKGQPAPVILPASVSRNETVTLSAGELVAGEVSEGGQTMDGMELDEDHVKTQQMLDQVTTMVKENPDGAASLVKRWMNRN